ncbi:hypothetical protein H0H87_012677 [Tephrocybe sp. NHM501043]|nr:hypothetical protein H0H87_012677 [Tephrocybe sp. NHM501043]
MARPSNVIVRRVPIPFSLWNRFPNILTVLRKQQWRGTVSKAHGSLATKVIPSVKRGRVFRTISTLDPEKLRSTDFVDLSEYRVPTITMGSIGACELRYAYRSDIVPFPPNTRGFLYYHTYRNLPPTCGEIRFRLTVDSNPGNFADGTDLIGCDAIPWSISSLTLSLSSYANARKQLEDDRLISKSLSNNMDTLRGTFKVTKSYPREMYYLEQPFMFDMNWALARFKLVTATEVRPMQLQKLFVDQREGGKLGRLLLRFERSRLPDDVGTNTAVLRVLKILDPIKLSIPGYDAHIPLPEAGSLLLKQKYSRTLVCSWDLDDGRDHVASALKILPSACDSQRTTFIPKLLKSADFINLSRS